MRIDAYNQVNMIYKTTGTAQKKKTVKTSGTEDKLEISQFGRDYQIAKAAVAQADDVREDRVDEVKAEYESGKYNVSADKLAQKLVDKYNAVVY